MSLWDLIRSGRRYRREQKQQSLASTFNFVLNEADRVAREQQEAREREEQRARSAAEIESACLRNGGAWFPED